MRFRKPGMVVMVSWEDCFSVEDWGPVDDRLEQHDIPVPAITVGIVLKHDKLGITIVRTYQELDRHCEGSFFIPTGMIRSIDDWKGMLIDLELSR